MNGLLVESSSSLRIQSTCTDDVNLRKPEVGVLGCEAIRGQLMFVLNEIVEPGVPIGLPARSNCAVQGTEELIAHYVESEIREVLGETRGGLGWPPHRMKKLRGHLKGLHNSLEGARKKWVNEENAIDAKRALLNEAIVAKRLQTEERRLAFEARWKEVKAKNLKALDEGTFEGPIVPIGFKPPEPKKKAEKAGKAEESEKVSFLHLGDELPEFKNVAEGGSTGSGEAPPPVPPPLEEPPPLEQPPPLEEPAPEAPLTKAEEVKKKVAEGDARLEVSAYVALEDEFIAVAKPEDLRLEDREVYDQVRCEGLGVCARCRWLSGCQSCDERKAWGFACRSTLWNEAHEAVRPKAKPKGRPKKAAAKA